MNVAKHLQRGIAWPGSGNLLLVCHTGIAYSQARHYNEFMTARTAVTMTTPATAAPTAGTGMSAGTCNGESPHCGELS